MTVRTLVVWCPDWPVVAAARAARVDGGRPAVVLSAGRVLVASATARAAGVCRGLRRREAQARCPDLVVLDHDPDRDARAFEPVVATVESVLPGVEVVRPGICAAASRGATRYFGGDAAVVAHLEGVVAGTCAMPCRVGIADGPFAAGLAARRREIVALGGTPAFLAPLPVEVLDRPELADLLRRLGVRTLEEFARLPARDVLARFGPDGAAAHRLAAGLDERPLATRRPPPDLTVQVELDPPVERVDTAAFAAKALADELHDRLAGLGLACARLAIEAQTEHGEQLTRIWRHDGPLTAPAIADRVRWQLDGWLSGTANEARPTAGVSLLRLVPDQVVSHDGQQLGLWGGAGEGADRAGRALARVQGMLGPQAVVTALVTGGRGPEERIRLVPWGEPPEADRSGSQCGSRRPRAPGRAARRVEPPWPGRIPPPAPATVLPRPQPALVASGDGAPVGVTGRYAVTAPPAWLSVRGGPPVPLAGWAGPWPADERWWDPPTARRRARFQMVARDGPAWLLSVEGGRWWVEAVYD